MKHLKQVFDDMGFSDIKTYIQSGNVIFKTQQTDKTTLIKVIENQLLKTFSVEIKTAPFTANEWIEIIENAPENFGSELEKFRYDVWFLLPSITIDEIVPNVRLREGVDSLYAIGNAIYTTRLTVEMGKSHLAKNIQMPFYKHVTIRNWNTTTKLLTQIYR